MQGIDKITARITSDAKAEGEAVLAGARAEAEELTRKIAAEADAELDRLAAAGDKAAEERAGRLKAAAGLEARKSLLAAKQEMISQAFDGAVAELGAMPEDKLVKLLARLISEASVSGCEQIVLAMADHIRFGKKTAESANAMLKAAGRQGNLTLSASPRPLTGGGFMLSDGDTEINGTFAAIVSELKNELTMPVAKILFE